MEGRGSITYSLELANNINPIPRIDTYLFKNYSILSCYLRLGLPRNLLLVGSPVKFLKELLTCSMKAIYHAQLFF